MRPRAGFLGVLLGLLLAHGAGTQRAHAPLKPQRVQFQSRNFHNVLHWQPGKVPAGDLSLYFVQYKMYGQRQWHNKEACWGIRALLCDLTNETSAVQEPYYARVRTASAGVLSGWSTTQRFTPWWETKLDPPVMNITQINGSLVVVLRAPDLPYKDQKGKNISMENYYEIVYRVFIINNSLEKERKVYEGAHRVVEIQAPASRSGYCVVAEMYRPMFDRSSHRSEERCVKTA
ncbi:interleukin-22 receptor subunit alpha-2 [Dasypus novemcinctus]|uniref:interleukin-22 receptor subunit alpha-2 n=1 Tax=Dasypus novemcinctus TaxID=9361 RepID=UPI00265D7619|nr:interleukin-22 receptor subunit alpha-2 [Dasypus novemcinctus]